MLARFPLLLACLLDWAAAQCGVDEFRIAEVDLNRFTNPSLTMTWADADGTEYNGVDNAACIRKAGETMDQCNLFTNYVQPERSDGPNSPSNGGDPWPVGGDFNDVDENNIGSNGRNSYAPFPGGWLRFHNAGIASVNSVPFDLLFTVPVPPEDYAATIPMEYVSPTDFRTTQAALTSGGFACIGFGLRVAICDATGETPDFYTAECPSGGTTIMRGTELEVQLLVPDSGPTPSVEPVEPIEGLYVTFYDVDGDDSIPTGRLFEINAVRGALDVVIDTTSTLEEGFFASSETRYVIATEEYNVPTSLVDDVKQISDESLPAIGSFRLANVNSFRMMIGGKSSVPEKSDRGYCFTMLEPSVNVLCSPPPPKPPVSPVPSPPPPLPPPPPPPTPHPPPAPIQPGERWGAYLIELNFTYPGTRSELSFETEDGVTTEVPETPVGTTTDTRVPTIVTNLKNSDSTDVPDLVTTTLVFRNDEGSLQRTPTPIGNGLDVDGNTVMQTFESISSADMDEDGLNDLVVAYTSNPTTPLRSSGVRVYINPGNGDFSTVLPIDVGATDQKTVSVTTVDINNDGKVDIIAGNKNQVNKLYLNLGDGVFLGAVDSNNPAIDIGTEADETTIVTTADLFKDAERFTMDDSDPPVAVYGAPAIIVGNKGSTNKVYRVTLFPGANLVDSVAFGEAIVIGSDSLAEDTRDITTGNLDGDTWIDIVVGNSEVTNKAYINPGAGGGEGGAFNTVESIDVGTETDDTRSIAFDTFGGPTGTVRIVTGNAVQTNKMYTVSGTVSQLATTTPTTIGTETDDTRSISIANMDNGANLDIVVTNAGMPVKVYTNPGSDDFSAVVPTLSTGGSADDAGTDAHFSLGLGDLDSNGYLDVIAGNQMFLNPGGASAGDFSSVEPHAFASLGDDVKSVAVADLDMDGDQDVVFSIGPKVLIYLNPTGSMDRFFQGSTYFANVNPVILDFSSVSAIQVVRLADLNGDGYADIIAGSAPGTQSSYYLNDGTGNFPGSGAGFLGSGTLGDCRAIFVTDLNGDGVLDILLGLNGQPNEVYFGAGSGIEWTLQPTPTFIGSETDSTFAIGAGDMNMDGYMDVVAGNYGQTNKVYLGSVSSNAWPTTTPGTFVINQRNDDVLQGSTDKTRALVVADTDGDGWLDVVVGNEGEQNRVYYGDGQGEFWNAGGIINAEHQTLAMVVGDLNNDGNLDAVAGNYGMGTEVTLGVSVVVPFDMTSHAQQIAAVRGLDFTAEGNPNPIMNGLEVIVGDPVYSPTNFDGTPDHQCRNPADPYIPVTVRFRLDFPLVVCYTPECIILNPLEGIGKAVTNGEGSRLLQCPSSGIAYSHIHREVLAPPRLDCNAQPIYVAFVDFDITTNPNLAMTWEDANGNPFNGVDHAPDVTDEEGEVSQLTNFVPVMITDTSTPVGAPFPGGRLRLSNVGNDAGVVFDLIITVPDQFEYYAETLPLKYETPMTSTTTQAAVTSGGYVCLGFALGKAECFSGAQPEFYSASCPDNTDWGTGNTRMKGTEFLVRMVETGTETLLTDPHASYITFYDVDGDDSIPGGRLYEINGVRGSVEIIIDPTSTLEAGQFNPSEAQYVIASYAVNIPTDLLADVNTLAAVSPESLAAIASFRMADVAEFRLMVGGRSSIGGTDCTVFGNCQDRGYCFTMKEPDIPPPDCGCVSYPCEWPPGTRDYTIIAYENATLEAHSFYTGLAIKEWFKDGTPAAAATVGGYSHVGTIDPMAQVHWHGGVVEGGPFPFDTWAWFEDLADRLINGTYGWYTIYVVDQPDSGGWYNSRSFGEYNNPIQGEDNGRTLVVFRGTGPVYLTVSYDGRQFGPSVLAPRATVVIASEVGFVDGIIIARNVGEVGDTSEVQLHGDPYRGPLVCRPGCENEVPYPASPSPPPFPPGTDVIIETTPPAKFTGAGAEALFSAFNRPVSSKAFPDSPLTQFINAMPSDAATATTGASSKATAASSGSAVRLEKAAWGSAAVHVARIPAPSSAGSGPNSQQASSAASSRLDYSTELVVIYSILALVVVVAGAVTVAEKLLVLRVNAGSASAVAVEKEPMTEAGEAAGAPRQTKPKKGSKAARQAALASLPGGGGKKAYGVLVESASVLDSEMSSAHAV